jgi:lipid-binding SYLF domain-containing protein/osmotically-inducible protein OsmY
MLRRLFRSVLAGLSVTLMLSLISISVPAQTRHRMRANDAARHARQAAEVFNEIMGVKEQSIPKDLLNKAEAVAVFPDVLKAAFIVGGRGGQGVISRRTVKGWTEPAFFKLGGGSFGAQIGVEKTDYVLLIMNDDGLHSLLNDKFEFGGEASAAAGPVGRTASAATSATLNAAILSYSRSHGAFAGVSLKGAVVEPDNDLNRAFYGKTAREILTDGGMALSRIPSAVRIFPETLDRYSRRESHHSLSPSASEINNINRLDPSQSPSTARIAREVKHELLMLPYYSVFDWISFQVQPDHTVILHGSVVSPPDTKSAAAAAVKDVEGVKGVVNEIQVLPVSPMDDRLRQALYRAVYSGPLFRYAFGSLNQIHIVVKNGNATLEGLVDSTSDRQLAYMQAMKVTGVFSVTNNLQITSEIPR